MPTLEETRLKKLEKSFKAKLIKALDAILYDISANVEVKESTLLRATHSAEALVKVYELEGEKRKKKTLQMLLTRLTAKDMERFADKLEDMLDLIKGF